MTKMSPGFSFVCPDSTDEAVLDLVPVVIGETLMSGTAAVEAVGTTLGIDMADLWAADTAFFDLIRNREGAEPDGRRGRGRAPCRGQCSREDQHAQGDRPRASGWRRWTAEGGALGSALDAVCTFGLLQTWQRRHGGAASKIEAARAVLDEDTSLAKLP